MYLDKPMRDHVLLQAIARVNRPYEDDEGRKKPCGFVLDFVGIFDKLEKALSFDSHDIAGVLKDISVLKERFTILIEKGQKQYLSLIKGKKGDKAVEAILEHFRNEIRRTDFYEYYNETSTIYEILSPDGYLRPYITDYDTLSRIFRIVKEAFDPSPFVDKEFTRKTARLVQEHTKSGKIRSSLDIYEINAQTLKKLEKSQVSDTEKVFNLLKTIEHTILERFQSNPYLISIGERAEIVSILFKQRQKDTKETLEDLKEIVNDINLASKEQIEKKMSTDTFSIYWILKNEQITQSEEIAKSMNKAFDQYPHWKTSEEQERKIKAEMYKIFGKNKVSLKKAVEIVTKLCKILKEGQ
jgi:type I restriction enzyme R subunit